RRYLPGRPDGAHHRAHGQRRNEDRDLRARSRAKHLIGHPRLVPLEGHTRRPNQGIDREPGVEMTPATTADSRVTIHMAASLDGFVARKDGRVDWLETSDEFAGGSTMDPGFVEAVLETIDCYVMGSRTYETALRFEAQGVGWSYGAKPTFLLTRRDLPRIRGTL